MHRHDWPKNNQDLSSANAIVREKDRVRCAPAAARSDLKFGDELRRLERYAKHAVAFEAHRSRRTEWLSNDF